MSTYKTGLDGFQKILHPCALDESSLSIGRVNLVAGHLICTKSIMKK